MSDTVIDPVADDDGGDPVAGDALVDLLNGFIVELREAGLPVSLTEHLDAMEAVRFIPLDDRSAFKYALAATLVKNHAHWRAFETVFEVYFSLRGAEYVIDPDAELSELPEDVESGDARDGAGQAPANAGSGEALTPEELAQMLYQALLQGDDAMMRAMARQAVRRYAGMEPGRPVGGTYYLYRTMRNLDLDGMLEQMMQQSREDAPEPQRARRGPPTGGRGDAPSSSRNQVFVSAERKQAMMEAGIWDDPKLRRDALRRYAEFDRNSAR